MSDLDMDTQYALAFRLRVKIAEFKNVWSGEGYDLNQLPAALRGQLAGYEHALSIVEKP
jgi:hypothetical protein